MIPFPYYQRAARAASSPVRRRPPITVPNSLLGVAADLEVDEEAGPVVVGDPVACAPGDCPSAVARTGSAENWADTPEELVQLVALGVPTPVTKFTCMHCVGNGVRKRHYI